MKTKREIRKLKRKIAALEAQLPDPDIPGPAFDPQSIWRDHVNDYSAWIDDGYEGWRTHGYL